MRFALDHARLDAALASSEALWRPKPFHTPHVPWRSSHAPLFRSVVGLSDAELLVLQQDTNALQAFMCECEPSFAEVAAASRAIEEMASRFTQYEPRKSGRDHIGIPGKKWEQIEAFSAAVPRRRQPAVEYCSGKGYLSQRLIANGVATSATCLEIDANLCALGRQLAAKAALPLTFEEADVLDASALAPTVRGSPASSHVALHACGGLHRQALRSAVAAGASVVACAPCCYHKHAPGGDQARRFAPLSAAAARSRLVRDVAVRHDELKLASAGECAARRRDARLRLREMRWRLAFGVWQRRALVRGRQLPAARAAAGLAPSARIDWSAAARLPSVPLPLLSQGSSAPAARAEDARAGFAAFCRWGAHVDGGSAPYRHARLQPALAGWSDAEAARCLAAGAARAARVARLELVRHAYRRPLEQWLLLDQCLYLAEHGYAVELRAFCAPRVSPRNLLVVGTLT